MSSQTEVTVLIVAGFLMRTFTDREMVTGRDPAARTLHEKSSHAARTVRNAELHGHSSSWGSTSISSERNQASSWPGLISDSP